ncbi:MAG: lactate utilization protein C, partial [Fimbriimonas sp.]
MDAKTEIIDRIKRASATPVEADRVPVRASQRGRAEIVDQFAEYVAEYRATVVRVGQAELSQAIKALLHERGSE